MEQPTGLAHGYHFKHRTRKDTRQAIANEAYMLNIAFMQAPRTQVNVHFTSEYYFASRGLLTYINDPITFKSWVAFKVQLDTTRPQLPIACEEFALRVLEDIENFTL